MELLLIRMGVGAGKRRYSEEGSQEGRIGNKIEERIEGVLFHVYLIF